MLRIARLLRRGGDSLNAGSSMTLGSKGSKGSPSAHRRRMPWTASREYVPAVVLNSKDKMILDGTPLLEADSVERAAQQDPLEVLKAAVAARRFHTSTGHNIFQLAAELPYHGRGQRFYRREWQEGTYDKYITLSAVDYDRDGSKGTAYGYITFHGESTTRPVQIDYADVPGWHVLADEAAAVSFDRPVPPPPSIGTDVAVDPATYRLKAYPYYDAPNPPEFVERLLKDRGVIPDLPSEASAVLDEVDGGAGADSVKDGSQHYTSP